MSTITTNHSVLETIGNTPLIFLERMCANLPGKVFAKAEFFNPGGSMKDRIALKMIEDAEQSGRLKQGTTVLEITSGNTGIGLATVCAVKGYKFIAVMSEGNSIERQQILRALGAELELVAQTSASTPGEVTGDDLQLVDKRARQLAAEINGFLVDQFNNNANIAAHAETTGEEIWQQMNGQVDVFLSVVGTAGTFIGTSRTLKKYNFSVQCLAVEPATAPVLAGKPVSTPRHKLQGSSYAMIPPLWDASVCDGFLTVTDEEAVNTARLLAEKEGLLVGYTAGGNVAAALQIAKASPPGTRIVTILCDTGLKYLSSDLYKPH